MVVGRRWVSSKPFAKRSPIKSAAWNHATVVSVDCIRAVIDSWLATVIGRAQSISRKRCAGGLFLANATQTVLSFGDTICIHEIAPAVKKDLGPTRYTVPCRPSRKYICTIKDPSIAPAGFSVSRRGKKKRSLQIFESLEYSFVSKLGE